MFRHRQGEDEFGSDTLGADDIDVFVVGIDDLLHDGKSKAGAFLVLASGEVRLIKSVEDEF